MTTLLVRRAGELSEAESIAISAAATALGSGEGRDVLTEQARRALVPSSEADHLIVVEDSRVVSYAQLRHGPHQLELEFLGDVVDRDLIDVARGIARGGETRLVAWVHGRAESSRPVLPGGVRVIREIRRLSRALPGPDLPAPPASITLRSFVPSVDDSDWLALNARTFHEHPDQGRWEQSDLRARLVEPWFDASGFLIAQEEATMVGWCWTKIHRDPWGQTGEIYVIGVDPDHVGRGLGRFLVCAGMDSLWRRKQSSVMLYVESTNEAALALYDSLDFSLDWCDVLIEISTELG